MRGEQGTAGFDCLKGGHDVSDALRRVLPNGRARVVVALGLALLLVALVAHGVIYTRVHDEGDEILYRTLMQQIRAGKGYSIAGLPDGGRCCTNVRQAQHLADVKKIYDKPVFPQHPPGGVLLFVACEIVTPGFGASTAQLFGLLLFFSGTLLMWFSVERDHHPVGAFVVAATCAFSPIAAHVATKQWLDGPLLGFATLGSGFYLFGTRFRRWPAVAFGGLLLCCAAWTKLTAIGVLPWLLALSLATEDECAPRMAKKAAPILLGAALFSLVPWQVWLAIHRMTIGVAMPPSDALQQINSYVRFVTVERSSLIYFTLTPFIMWTLVPTGVLLWQQRGDRERLKVRSALCLWIVGSLLTYSVLGFIGYSKLLRYAILISPAAILLFSDVTTRVMTGDSPSPAPRRVGMVLALSGLGLEAAQGVFQTFWSRLDMMVPIVLPALNAVLRSMTSR